MRAVPSNAFRHKVRLLPGKLQAAVAERLRFFMQNPQHPLLHDHALTGKRVGQRSINVTGDWRIVYEPIEPDITLLVDVDTHHNLYGT